MLINETEQDAANEIEVVAAENIVCGSATRVCDPESFFEMIEQCKICGRCV